MNNTENQNPAGKPKLSVKLLLLIQLGVILYTCSSICAKMTSRHPAMSLMWIVWLGLEVFCLGVYAIYWQQIIKRVDLSIAYANRATAIFWSMMWAVLIFSEHITVANVLGVLVIFAGIMVVNRDAA